MSNEEESGISMPMSNTSTMPSEDLQTLSVATTIPPINLKASNLALAWKNWKAQFKIFLRASNLEQQLNQRKVALLLHHMGSESLQIFLSFNEDMDSITLNNLIEKFDAYFLPKVNIAMERHKFFTRRQDSGESMDEYVTTLKNLSLSCEFRELREDLVRDIFVCGLSSNLSRIKEKQLREGDIKLQRAVDIAKSMEIAKENTCQLQQHDGQFVGAVYKIFRIPFQATANKTPWSKSNTDKYQQNSSPCTKCGQVHKNKCPAIGVTCFVCNKLNHFAKMCFSKSQQQRQHKQSPQYNKYVKNLELNDSDANDNEEDLYIGVLQNTNKSTFWAKETFDENNKFSNNSIQSNIVNSFSKAATAKQPAEIPLSYGDNATYKKAANSKVAEWNVEV